MREIRIAVSDDWMDFALCRGNDTEVFFCDENDRVGVALAKRVCMQCPVAEPCLEMGMKMRHGIWGGMTAKERSMMRSLE